MKEEIGTVISTLEGPSPSNVDIVVKEGTVHRGQFVELDYSEGTMIALIVDVIKTNRYFERAESVKEFESNNFSLFEQFPVSEWEFLVARTKPLGVFFQGKIKRSTFPPSPGTKARVASSENLKKFLSFDESGLFLGEIEFHNVPVKLNLTRLLQKHLAIMAMSGAGKSITASVLIEELLSRKPEQGRIAIIIIDAHGEYKSFALPVQKPFADFSDKTRLVDASEMKIGVSKLSIELLSTIIPGLSAPQKRDLAKIISNKREEMHSGNGPFSLNDLRKAIAKDSEIKDATKQILLGWIQHLMELRLFAETDLPSITDLVQPGTLTVIDLSGIIDLKKKQIITSYLSRKLFYERRKKIVSPFLLIIEEAHQMAPEKAKREAAISKGIIETIAREGRKFGASLCLISQRPIQLSTTAISQCGTHIFLRITNPYDLQHIAQSSEALDKKSMDILTSLRTGEALIVGEAVNFPVFVKIRNRKSQPSPHELTLEQAAKEFEEKKEIIEEEAKEFM